jgi:hypothetical protein
VALSIASPAIGGAFLSGAVLCRRHTERAIIHSSSGRIATTATRLAAAEITPALAAFLSTAASRLALRLGTGGRGQKLLPTVIAAKIEPLSIAFGVESGCFFHGHSGDGVFGHGCRFFQGDPCLLCKFYDRSFIELP